MLTMEQKICKIFFLGDFIRPSANMARILCFHWSCNTNWVCTYMYCVVLPAPVFCILNVIAIEKHAIRSTHFGFTWRFNIKPGQYTPVDVGKGQEPGAKIKEKCSIQHRCNELYFGYNFELWSDSSLPHNGRVLDSINTLIASLQR